MKNDHQESLALIEDLKKVAANATAEKEQLQQQYDSLVKANAGLQARAQESESKWNALAEENKRLKVGVPKTPESKQLAKCQQRIAELEAEVEAANKRSSDVFEEGKALAKKQLEIETKDRALKAKLRRAGTRSWRP